MSILKNERLYEYLKTFSNPTIRERGKLIFDKKRLNLKKLVQLGMGEADFAVLSDDGSSHEYRVKVTGFASENSILLSSCSCLYNQGGICKHRVAAVMALDQQLTLTPIYKKEELMADSLLIANDISDEEIKKHTLPDLWKLKANIKNIKISHAKDGIAELQIEYKKEVFQLRFEKIDKGIIKTSCTCNQTLRAALCEHKVAALCALKNEYGRLAFDVLKDWSEEKSKLLAEYGFTLAEDLSNKFEFRIDDNGKLNLVKIDPSIQKISQYNNWGELTRKLFIPSKEAIVSPETDSGHYEQVLVYTLIKQAQGTVPEVKIDAVTSKFNHKTGKFTKIESLSSRYISNLPSILPTDSKAISILGEIDQTSLEKFIRHNNLERNWYTVLNQKSLAPASFLSINEFLGKNYEILLPLLFQKRVFLGENDYQNINEMQEIGISLLKVRPIFELNEDTDFLILDVFLAIGEQKIKFEEIAYYGFWFIEYEAVIHKVDTLKDANLLFYFADKKQIKVKKNNFSGFFTDFIVPLSENSEVNFNIEAKFIYSDLHYKETRIFLKEDDRNLIITPAFVYQDFENPEQELMFSNDGRTQKIHNSETEIHIYKRNEELEKSTFSKIQSLHLNFDFQAGNSYFYLPFPEILKDNWLFDFFEKTKEANISVLGFKELKKLRYNPNRPKMEIKGSSGIDWFDMKVEISFGDQFVSLADLKKALVKKQNYVELKDGTLGMLPEEWLNKYSNLFRMGSIHNDAIKLSKLHFNIIDELIGEINDEDIYQELQEKKQKLLHFKEIKDVPFPTNVQATLRDYQLEGYKWLNFLDEFKWGGCLADDMGLGKTLQMLTFFQEQQNRDPKGTNLVVLPTTLIFNWQAEVEKFCPDLKYYVHRGVFRSKNLSFFKDYDLILTTYGTIRSDAETLKDFEFNYIVLDESQAIKNPDSLISKAVRLLKAKNRLVMTGTPVENNTFDLYSQMEFLNPGFLGSKEYFKTEYATPIDKYQDKVVALKLRNLLKPFLLKRTKEEVAKDLPEKTETILYCEMDTKQRKVYDTFREMYRLKIVDKMAVDGKDKSAFLILEGLLKLRQICDSPVLLSDDIDYGNESIKLEEILREIEENASNHKIVIFSQFLKMLDLIRQNLEKHQIPYEYLDGQTTDRAERVNRFQADQQCRVFLMSLKTGGVGINLTEADYVYLVDPWWNPAVEQQAIDRTHRIGQQKNVFAYRMICKDTIEEKILLLQAKKKDIANDLISTEAGFIKKLTRDDIVELFS
jgi:SNF2 family DNA or RNA helicase